MKKDSTQQKEQKAILRLGALHVNNSMNKKVLFRSSILQFDMRKITFEEFCELKHILNPNTVN
ncbi:hypothetical protein KJ603_01710 [Patescibacteria group bacterium]|nr:hypothetical protein [Patescibacteria group bacterium]